MAIITQEIEVEDVNSRQAWQYTAGACLKNEGWV